MRLLHTPAVCTMSGTLLAWKRFNFMNGWLLSSGGDILGDTSRRVRDPSDKTKHHQHSFPKVFSTKSEKQVGRAGQQDRGLVTRDFEHWSRVRGSSPPSVLQPRCPIKQPNKQATALVTGSPEAPQGT